MKEFEIEAKCFVTIKAKSLKDALINFSENYPSGRVETISEVSERDDCLTYEILGYCELCGCPIVEGSGYMDYFDGVYTCVNCSD